jgi:all-trans-retinol 13,14-reductase
MSAGKRAVRRKKIDTVVVVGAGFSGLVSSLLLARAGIGVTLLERSSHVAPLLRNYDLDGFEINHGFHYLGGYYPGGALHRCFEQLGIADKLLPIDVNDDGFDVFSGITKTEIAMPVGIERVKRVLEMTFPESGEALRKYFELLEKVFREFSFFSIESFFYKGVPDLTSVSLQGFLEEYHAEESLIDFLGAYSQMLLGLSAREVPFLTHLLGVGAYFFSAQTFRQGGGALVDALEEQVRRAGVRILTDSEVVHILCEERRHFTGLRIRSLNGGGETALEADACVSTIHPKRLLRLIHDGPAFHLFERRISDTSDTPAVSVFHLAVARDVAGSFLNNRHIYIRPENGPPRHHLTILPDFTGNRNPSPDERQMTVLMATWDNEANPNCPERLEGRCGHAERLQAGANSPVAASYQRRVTDDMAARLESVFPEMKGKYRVIDTMTPCHFDRVNATWDGSIYGVKCSLDRMGISTIGPMRGLFLAGQSITAPGIFGALVSAYLACNRITGNITL